MEIGKKLRQARLEAGLSQRQLCGDVITRNMLSLIENGSARPSMDTLAYLAERLEKPMGYFWEEANAASPNTACMEQARTAYTSGAFAAGLEILQEYRKPDELFDDEYGLLKTLLLLSRAEQVLARPAMAKELLTSAAEALTDTCYKTPELEQRLLLLLAQIAPEEVQLPVDDRPLLHRAQQALKEKNGTKSIALLEACEDKVSARWRYLRAEAAFLMEDYALAAEIYPPEEYARLEECYRNLGDYKKAYEYACKQR